MIRGDNPAAAVLPAFCCGGESDRVPRTHEHTCIHVRSLSRAHEFCRVAHGARKHLLFASPSNDRPDHSTMPAQSGDGGESVRALQRDGVGTAAIDRVPSECGVRSSTGMVKYITIAPESVDLNKTMHNNKR